MVAKKKKRNAVCQQDVEAASISPWNLKNGYRLPKQKPSAEKVTKPVAHIQNASVDSMLIVKGNRMFVFRV